MTKKKARVILTIIISVFSGAACSTLANMIRNTMGLGVWSMVWLVPSVTVGVYMLAAAIGWVATVLANLVSTAIGE